MPSLREVYFDCIKRKKDHVSESDIRDLLIYVNRLNSYTELSLKFNEDISDLEKLNFLFERLQSGEMIQYILGKANFLGEDFFVSPDVLIPRQETEELVTITINLVNERFKSKEIRILDLCTGSGILGITLKNSFPSAEVYVSDISEKALDICKKNITKFNQNIGVLQGNFLEPVIKMSKKFDIIICNPPYIETNETIDKRTWEQEPHLALLASPGTKFYEELILNIPKVMNDHFLVAFEIGEDLKDRLEAILLNNGFKNSYMFEKDLYGKDRFLFIMK